METIHDSNGRDSVISCSDCRACCCRLEVMLMGDDEAVPAELTIQDQWGGWVMRRLADGWCAALARDTMKCAIYQHRPIICRDYQTGESDCLEQRAQFADSVGIANGGPSESST
ncbi:MAG: YkgJ family cysteine cluster protein [Gallionella sp.]